MGIKITYCAKKCQKSGFFGVVRSALRRFGISPYDADGAKSHRMATQLDAHSVATTKKALLCKKKLRFEPKTVKKMGFLGYTGLH